MKFMESFSSAKEGSSKNFSHGLVEYIFGSEAVKGSETAGLIDDITQWAYNVPEIEKRAIINSLASRAIDGDREMKLSEEGAELLLRIALHPGDKKAFFSALPQSEAS